MTKYARIIDNTAVEVFTPPAGVSIADCFHADIAAQFTSCAEEVTPGSVRKPDGNWTLAQVVAAPVVVPAAPQVSPVQFKLLFTAAERVAIKASTDAIVRDFDDIVNDPRLTFVDLGLQSTKDALAYLETVGLLTAGRAAAILTGVVQ